jgi:hypothetical protein
MKKLALVSLAVAAALAFSHAAKADNFSFDFVGQSPYHFAAQGTLQATPTANPGVFTITSMTGTFTDLDNGLNIVNQPIVLIPPHGILQMVDTVQGWALEYVSPDGEENYDNQLNYPGTPYYLDSTGGLLFASADGYQVNIAQGSNNRTPYSAWVNFGNSWVDVGNGYDYGVPLDLDLGNANGAAAVVPVPEGGGLVMLALCGLGLAGAFLFKTGNQELLSF